MTRATSKIKESIPNKTTFASNVVIVFVLFVFYQISYSVRTKAPEYMSLTNVNLQHAEIAILFLCIGALGLALIILRKEIVFNIDRFLPHIIIVTVLAVLTLAGCNLFHYNAIANVIASSVITICNTLYIAVYIKTLVKFNIVFIALLASANAIMYAIFLPLLQMAPSYTYYALITLSPFVIFLFLNKYTDEKTSKKDDAENLFRHTNSKKQTGRIPHVLVSTIALIGFCTQLIYSLRMELYISNTTQIVLSLSLLIVGAIGFIVCTNKKFNYNLLFYLTILPLFAMSLLLLSDGQIIGFQMTNYIARSISQISIISLIIYLAKFSPISRYMLVISGFTGLFTGKLIALVAVYIAQETVGINIAIEQFTPYTVFAILVICIVLFRNNNMAHAWGSASVVSGMQPTDEHAKACNEISKKYNLTSRETDVVELVGKGYTAKAISDKLYISINTTTMHTKNIYKKLGVHSKRELIDVIDEHKHA